MSTECVTLNEAKEVLSLMESLEILAQSFELISFEDIQLIDSNGEPIGVIHYENGVLTWGDGPDD